MQANRKFANSVSLVAALIAGNAVAEVTEIAYEIADILNVENSIVNVLARTKAKPGTSAFLRCETSVNPKGRFENTYCYTKDKSTDDHLRLLLDALDSAKAKPASIEGKRKIAWLQFTMRYDANTQTFRILQNSKRDEARFGAEYQGPQRYKSPRNCASLTRKPIIVAYQLDATGEIVELQVTPKLGREKLSKKVKGCFSRMKFLPAHRDGIPTESVVIEALFHGPTSRKLEPRKKKGAFDCTNRQC